MLSGGPQPALRAQPATGVSLEILSGFPGGFPWCCLEQAGAVPASQNSTVSPGWIASTLTGLAPKALMNSAGVPGRPGLVP
jgi:hypothetical protein